MSDEPKRKPKRTPKNKAVEQAPENKAVTPPEDKAATKRRTGDDDNVYDLDDYDGDGEQ